METITHGLTGVVMAKAGLNKDLGRWGTWAGLMAGLFPDLDYIFILGGRELYIRYHRDFTHSLIFVVPIAVLLSILFSRLSGKGRFLIFLRICLPVLLVHILMDLITSYGTVILSPISSKRYAWDLVFILDPYFFTLLFIPFLAAILLKRWSKGISRISILLVSFYITFCAIQHNRAIGLASEFSRSQGIRAIRIASIPQPLSPFRWMNLIEEDEYVYQGFVDLLKRGGSKDGGSSFLDRLINRYSSPKGIIYRKWRKEGESPLVNKAMEMEGTRRFFWFARFPIAIAFEGENSTNRVEFFDLRFYITEDRKPFVYFVEFDTLGAVKRTGFSDDFLGFRRIKESTRPEERW